MILSADYADFRRFFFFNLPHRRHRACRVNLWIVSDSTQANSTQVKCTRVLAYNAANSMSRKTDPQRASTQTNEDLRNVAETLSLQGLSRLSLPEIEAAVKLVAQVVPAGNVPGMILSGLARLAGRKPPLQNIQRDVNALFNGMEQVLDKALYTAVFAMPARVLWGYQNLMKLAGMDPEHSFPEGTWQFYVDYALREDSARHANETHGFDSLLNEHNIQLSAVDRLTAWAMSALTCLHQYNALLENEWYERTAIALLKQDGVYRQWELQRPYRREADGANLNYPVFRRKKFDEFIDTVTKRLPATERRHWEQRLLNATQNDLPAYQKQMSILAYLNPGAYGETRVPFTLQQAQFGLIHQGHYYLLSACDENGSLPNVNRIRESIAAILDSSSDLPPARLTSLARVRRAALPELRNQLTSGRVAELDRLRYAPILLNSDVRPRRLPLAEIRQAERGTGDHALTIFDTGQTFVFDQSHIFFDGGWGAALAEIMTNEALSWAGYLNLLPAISVNRDHPPMPLGLQLKPAEIDAVQRAPHISSEASAETTQVNIRACLSLRKLFKQRNDLLQLTVNDLLVLYRAIHAVTYRPSPSLQLELGALSKTNPQAAGMVRAMWDESSKAGPSILIPVDASQKSPRERVHPFNIEVPLAELGLLNLHTRSAESLAAYESAAGDRTALYAEFDAAQRTYLASLAGFGSFMKKARETAIQGESASVGAIKLLAGLPQPLQRLLDKVPENFEVLNSLIKGREVFSNVGAVVSSSTLTRFITAKDDNEQKQLAWGVMTDAAGVMCISLRDFRPHVEVLNSARRRDLAEMITQDYLNAYALGFNGYIRDLMRITQASRETQSSLLKKSAAA